ncbi:hypothetical protein DE146DRAFT_732507 [Phaeosphaeria sp. MPI-PUGE-AT-0046c]|nr:hypothetical protein DE146DRAFT_732507 [Phaeosphaeria sp. MPI-PUGE-AT-0046c]
MADWSNTATKRYRVFAFERHYNTEFLRAEHEPRELHHTSRINPDPDELLEKGQSVQLIRATPPCPQQWRSTRTRSHPNTNLDRIYTDYILRWDVVDDINYMLDHIHNWSADDAYEIMQSFERDSSNEGRRVRFIPVYRESRQWLVRIENPKISAHHTGRTQDIFGDGFDVHRQHLKEIIPSSSRIPRMRQQAVHPRSKSKNFSPQRTPFSSTAQTKLCNEEKFEETLQGQKTRLRSPAAMILSKTDSKTTMSPALNILCMPITSSYRAESHGGSLLSSIVNVPNMTGSPTSAPQNESAKQKLKPAEWEKIERLDLVERLQPPPTPRLSPRDINFTDEQRDQLLAVNPMTMELPRYARERLRLPAVLGNIAVAKKRRKPKVMSRYSSFTHYTTFDGQYVCKALTPEDTQAKHLMEERAVAAIETHRRLSIEDVEKHKVDISHMLTGWYLKRERLKKKLRSRPGLMAVATIFEGAERKLLEEWPGKGADVAAAVSPASPVDDLEEPADMTEPEEPHVSPNTELEEMKLVEKAESPRPMRRSLRLASKRKTEEMQAAVVKKKKDSGQNH